MDEPQSAFAAFEARKIQEASTATICTLTTAFTDAAAETGCLRVGNAWTRLHYGGDFSLVSVPANRTSLSLVFVQSRDGNTGGDPRAFGGGDTDKHLVYEGLSRVAADAVLAGARTLHPSAFFSVWHPEIVALRQSLGLPRHPAQIVVSKQGHFDFTSLLFNVPEVPVFLIAGEKSLVRHASAIRMRPWVELIAFDGESESLSPAIDRLRREHRIHRISAVGGRSTAARLVDEGLAQDIYLTTGFREGGESGTPWYGGARLPALTVTTRKVWTDGESRAVFEHILIGQPSQHSMSHATEI